MTMLYLFSGLLLLSFLITWFSYRKAFYSPKMRKEDPYALPKGEQYEKERWIYSRYQTGKTDS